MVTYYDSLSKIKLMACGIPKTKSTKPVKFLIITHLQRCSEYLLYNNMSVHGFCVIKITVCQKFFTQTSDLFSKWLSYMRRKILNDKEQVFVLHLMQETFKSYLICYITWNFRHKCRKISPLPLYSKPNVMYSCL